MISEKRGGFGLQGPEENVSAVEVLLENSWKHHLGQKKTQPVLRDGARASSAKSSGLTSCGVSVNSEGRNNP